MLQNRIHEKAKQEKRSTAYIMTEKNKRPKKKWEPIKELCLFLNGDYDQRKINSNPVKTE